MPAFRSAATALGIKVQTGPSVPATVTTADLISCSDLKPAVESYTVPDNEYTGTIQKRGDALLGRSRSITFSVIIRGPGGTAPPAADAYVLGRLLRSAKHFEVSQPTPLIVPSAITGGTTTSGILPAGASAVNGFYNGFPVILSDQGVGVRGVSMIRDYEGATRRATFMETFPTAPAAQVSIPAFLGYFFDPSAPDVYLSCDYWLDKKRYKMTNGIANITGIDFNVSNRGEASNTTMQFTVVGDVDDLNSELDQDAPTLGALGGAIPFRDGDAWLSGKSVCGSSFKADTGLQVKYAPCPAGIAGSEPGVITEAKPKVSMTLNEVLLAKEDYNTLAQAGGQHGLWLQYGNASGKTVSFGVMNGRLGYSEAEPSGDFVTRSLEMMIDPGKRLFAFVFPYY